jgi:hypothetical protein
MLNALLFLLALGLAPAHSQQCSFALGTEPPMGACEGPVDRALARRRDVVLLNSGCEIDQVVYRRDVALGAAPPPNSSLLCGECFPGYAGAIDEYKTCPIDSFCSDDARCMHVTAHPLFGAPCPFDVPQDASFVSFCGMGLRCVGHVCKQCYDGEQDLRDGKMCVDGVWTYSKAAQAAMDPRFWALVTIAILVALNALLLCCLARAAHGGSKKGGRQRRDSAEANPFDFGPPR